MGGGRGRTSGQQAAASRPVGQRPAASGQSASQAAASQAVRRAGGRAGRQANRMDNKVDMVMKRGIELMERERLEEASTNVIRKQLATQSLEDVGRVVFAAV